MIQTRRQEGECEDSGTEELVPHVEGSLEDGVVLVWRLPPHLSQSRLGGRYKSNACTIIALKMAEAIHTEKIHFSAHSELAVYGPGLRSRSGIIDNERAAAGSSRCTTPAPSGLLDGFEPELQTTTPTGYDPPKTAVSGGTRKKTKTSIDATPLMISAVANSIIEGNHVHEWAVRELKRGEHELNFTIPDAIGACKNNFRELDYKTLKGGMQRLLTSQIKWALAYWEREGGVAEQSHLFLLVIAHERTVLITVQPQEKVLGLVDSHSHGKEGGALFASASYGQIHSFTRWLIANIFPETLAKKESEQSFEISMIRYDSPKQPSSYAGAGGGGYKSPYATRSQVSLGSASLDTRNPTMSSSSFDELPGGKTKGKTSRSPQRRPPTKPTASPIKLPVSPPKKAHPPESKGKVFKATNFRRNLKRQFDQSQDSSEGEAASAVAPKAAKRSSPEPSNAAGRREGKAGGLTVTSVSLRPRSPTKKSNLLGKPS